MTSEESHFFSLPEFFFLSVLTSLCNPLLYFIFHSELLRDAYLCPFCAQTASQL